MLYFSHVEIEVSHNRSLSGDESEPKQHLNHVIETSEAENEPIEEVVHNSTSKKRKRQINTSGYGEASPEHGPMSLAHLIGQDPMVLQERGTKDEDSRADGISHSLEQISVSLQHDLTKAQEELRDLRKLYQDELSTSQARKNANADLQVKLQKLKEIENILRIELKDAHVEQLEARARDARTIENLRQLEQKMRKDLFEANESSNEVKAKISSLEGDLRNMNDELTKVKLQVQTQTREAKRKDDYISELHRDIDRQGIEARKIEHRLQLATKEIDIRQARIKDFEHKYHKQERDHAAKLIKSHSDAEEKHRSRENELLRRIYVLEEGINGDGTTKQNTTLNLLNILAKNGKSDTPFVADIASDPSSTNAERDALLVSLNDLRNKYESIKVDLDKAQASAGQSDAYLKLLKANELLQKENLLLNNKVQDLSGGQQPDGVSAGKVESLTETIDQQSKELEALRRAVEQERARADRMTELAELGPESADGANDAWSTQF